MLQYKLSNKKSVKIKQINKTIATHVGRVVKIIYHALYEHNNTVYTNVIIHS